ncbi:hypothetical protein GON03_19160 [Nocardioides sp. MAH-18]|uniref:Uncharacterized protein n=1 Tax=Nocardioides agri TaxID=2682843 RepID=A0A6L6XY18_9ACTN|nr:MULTISPECIES: hypothetical protein [unclassified Nocardioides]MBA2952137.1 hypothetical protein [Nocardioides sp. CGMCC 1.13656]MVQ51306.1 hypothetical protein [Nocardioides sp. MAH-18]
MNPPDLDPSDSSWWWLYGLDGIIGGVIAGLVAAVAVLATLRHERRMSDLQHARQVASRLLAAAWTAQDRNEDPQQMMLLGIVELVGLSRRRWPELSDELEQLVTRTDIDDRETGREVTVLLLHWTSSPHELERNWRRSLIRQLRRARTWVLEKRWGSPNDAADPPSERD